MKKKNELKVGQKVRASVMRTGGSIIKITGKVAGFEDAFGRDDIKIKASSIEEEFVVNIGNVEVLGD